MGMRGYVCFPMWSGPGGYSFLSSHRQTMRKSRLSQYLPRSCGCMPGKLTPKVVEHKAKNACSFSNRPLSVHYCNALYLPEQKNCLQNIIIFQHDNNVCRDTS